MDGTKKALRSQFGEADCLLQPCPGWDCGVLFPGAALVVGGTWHAGDPATCPALLVAHLLASAPCFFLRCNNSGKPPKPWTDLHAYLTAENRTAVLHAAPAGRRSEPGAEVMLLPLAARDPASGAAEPVFAGFVAGLLGGDLVKEVLTTRRLPLVFDLDETLLVAKSQSQMAKELRALRDTRRPRLERAEGDPQRVARLAALDREEQLMQADLALLQQFAEEDAVTYKGRRLEATIETAYDDAGQAVERPVIRLPDDDDTLLTRIEPHMPSSSMVFKLRPNWRAIWGYLGGLMDPVTNQPVCYAPPSPKLRFQAYVCTAAERGYALEAWRVLDPDGWMIPVDKRGRPPAGAVSAGGGGWRAGASPGGGGTGADRPPRPPAGLAAGKRRVASGSKLKSLATVLPLSQAPQPGPGGEPVSPMPLAVIVDDRLDIWDGASRGQVLRVEPFKPWEEQAAQDLGLAGAPTMQMLGAQMIALKDQLFNLRMHAFHRVQEVLRRQLELLRTQPLSLAQPLPRSYSAALLPPPWVEGLLAGGLHARPEPEPLPPGLVLAMERPVDPRQLRRQQQQQGAAAPPPPPAPAAALPLAELAGPAGVELLAAVQGLLGGQPPQPQQPAAPPPMAPLDPRLALRQQQQQQQQQQVATQPPSAPMPPPMAPHQQLAEQQPARPHRQRPGKLTGPAAPGEQAAPGPGVAALQQAAAAADPRRRPASSVPAAASDTLSELFGLVSGGGPPAPQQQQQQQQQGGGRPRPMVKRLVGLHGPAPARAPTPPAPANRPDGLAPQQPAWGAANAAVAGAPAPPHLAGGPGAGGAPRPMARAPPAPVPAPAGGAIDEMRQLWMDSFAAGAPAAAPRPMQAAPRPMQRAPAPEPAAAGAKRKAPEGAEPEARRDRPPPRQAAAAGSSGSDAVAQLQEASQRQGARLQWHCGPAPGGGWHAAAYVGNWPGDYPSHSEPPAGRGSGPSQPAAMQAAAVDALQRLGRGGGPSTTAGGGGGGGGGGLTFSTAIDALHGHFPPGTNRVEWQEQPPAADGSWRRRLVINGGEFEAVGTGPPGARGEKRARQHAALLVLQQAGYAVSFDAPRGAPPPDPRPPPPGRMERRAGRSLDSRHAAAAAAAPGVAADAYLASLQDELG